MRRPRQLIEPRETEEPVKKVRKQYVKLDPADRSALVELYELSDVNQALALAFIPELIEFDVQRKGVSLCERSSALGRALESLCDARPTVALAYPPGDVDKQQAGRKAAKRWFCDFYRDPHADQPFCDKSTQVTVGNSLSEDDWVFLHDVLIEARYKDLQRNSRKFTGFIHYMEWLGKLYKAKPAKDTKEEIDTMTTLLKKSKAKGWKHLEITVAQRFDLRTVREHWHDMRDGKAAQNEAKRLQGILPCGDCYYRKASNARKAPPHSNSRLIKCLPPTPQTGELAGVEPSTYLFYHEPSLGQVLRCSCFCDVSSIACNGMSCLSFKPPAFAAAHIVEQHAVLLMSPQHAPSRLWRQSH